MGSKFLIDEQTKKDIQLINSSRKNLFDFFNKTKTEGGDRLIGYLFYSPTTDIEEIRTRQSKIKRLLPFSNYNFNFDRLVLKDIDKFLASSDVLSLSKLNVLRITTPEYFYTKRSILEIIDVLSNFNNLLSDVLELNQDEDFNSFYIKSKFCLGKLLGGKKLKHGEIKINHFNINNFYENIHYELIEDLKSILEFVYEIDCYLAIAKSVCGLTFCFPDLYPKGKTQTIDIRGLYNVFHQKPVANDILMTESTRNWFLTGPNMAGKSSLIKSISVAIYLAQIGLPVPAVEMKADILDGLFTSINLDDNMDLGYSHFFNEAIRLKEIIDKIDKRTNILIIFDELFKGTNNKDVEQAIYEIMKYFGKSENLFTIVSSHVVELSDKLRNLDHIKFVKMNIERDNEGMPFFTYKISEGVSYERLGKWLLNKSGVLDSFEKLLR